MMQSQVMVGQVKVQMKLWFNLLIHTILSTVEQYLTSALHMSHGVSWIEKKTMLLSYIMDCLLVHTQKKMRYHNIIDHNIRLYEIYHYVLWLITCWWQNYPFKILLSRTIPILLTDGGRSLLVLDFH